MQIVSTPLRSCRLPSGACNIKCNSTLLLWTVVSPSMYATIPTVSVACLADPGMTISKSETITTTSGVPTISTAGAESSISSHITNDVTSICQMIPPVSIVTSGVDVWFEQTSLRHHQFMFNLCHR